jgi:hypothetical protein
MHAMGAHGLGEGDIVVDEQAGVITFTEGEQVLGALSTSVVLGGFVAVLDDADAALKGGLHLPAEAGGFPLPVIRDGVQASE